MGNGSRMSGRRILLQRATPTFQSAQRTKALRGTFPQSQKSPTSQVTNASGTTNHRRTDLTHTNTKSPIGVGLGSLGVVCGGSGSTLKPSSHHVYEVTYRKDVVNGFRPHSAGDIRTIGLLLPSTICRVPFTIFMPPMKSMAAPTTGRTGWSGPPAGWCSRAGHRPGSASHPSC